jgi:ribosome-binding factor A
MSQGRMRRVDEAIRQVLGDAMAGGLKDPRVGFVTVTDVKTSADLRHARVYVSVLGEHGQEADSARREATLEGLRSAHGFLQGRVAAELRLKRTPALEFAYDDTTDRALRIEALIEQAPRAADAERGTADEPVAAALDEDIPPKDDRA